MQAPQRQLYPLNAMANGDGRGGYSPTSAVYHRSRQHATTTTNSIFGTFDDPLFQLRAEALANAMDVKNVTPAAAAAAMLRPSDVLFGNNNNNYPTHHHLQMSHHQHHQQQPVTSSTGGGGDFTDMDHQMVAQYHQHHPFSHQSAGYPTHFSSGGQLPTATTSASTSTSTIGTLRYPLNIMMPTSGGGGEQQQQQLDTVDPRELERFAEHFKQRRIKLGVTQADVGKALAHLKMAGVGSLSQSTICRFESLTLSHNNMIALKPILHSWLEKAEEAVKAKETMGGANGGVDGDASSGGILPNSEKKRKRTSIAAPEKRLLEDYFRQQPRPSGERIAAIADRLDLKKNVVRVWFCNQRQKQKRCRNQTTVPVGRLPTVVVAAAASKCAPSFGGYFGGGE